MSVIANSTPKLAKAQHSTALIGIAAVPKPCAPGETSAVAMERANAACKNVQTRHLNAAQAAHAAQIDENVVQATNLARTKIAALINELNTHNLTLRATYMPPAVDSSPVCAEITTEALTQALTSKQPVRVPHPLGLGHFDMQCSANGIDILQYSV